MNDNLDTATEGPSLVIATRDAPAFIDLNDEALDQQECGYCGHYPCGCGG